MRVLGRAARLLLGAAFAWCVALAAVAPEVPLSCALAAAAIFVTTVWRRRWGLALMAALAPAGALFAPAPARAAEMFAWALLAGWLLRLWRPLSASRPWPRAFTIPAALYGAALVASWLALTIAGAAGVPLSALPQFLLHSIPQDHLIFSSPETETWTLMLSMTGVAVFVASVGITREDPRVAGTLARTLVGSMALLAAATAFDVARQWAESGYGGWFLLRYVQGERFSLHLADLNAAGSLYVLAGIAAATLAWFDRERRRGWIVMIALMVPALWLTGSRSSYVAAIGALLILAAAQHRWQPTRQHVTAAAALLLVVLLGAALVVDWQSEVPGSAGRAVNLRSQFFETSARMFASSPVFGVGIGRYFDRSAEFMPTGLRELYGNENAHNYFVQQFAELGMVGGLLFVWLVTATLSTGWASVRRSGGDAASVGLFAGAGAYLLTCVTGHPLLVPEAALPFWAAFGVVASISSDDAHVSKLHRAMACVACALLVTGVGRGALAYARMTMPPSEYGFHGIEAAADGTRFRWMTRHAVTYIPDGPGFVTLRVRAPDRAARRPLVVTTSIGGRVVDRRELPQGRWVGYAIPARDRARTRFRRVDFRVNQMWTEEISLGRRRAQRPIAVMAEDISWIPLR